MVISGLVLDILVKATLLLLITLAIDRILNQASAAVKHRLWGMCFVLLLLLPLLSVSVPQWRLAVLPTSWRVSESVEPIVSSVPVDASVLNSELTGGSSQQADLDSNMHRKAGYPNVDKAPFTSDKHTVIATPLSNSEVAPSASSANTLPDQVEQSRMAKAMHFLPICLWLFGGLIATLPLIVGIIRTQRIKQQSKQICDPNSAAFVSQLCMLLGIRRRVRLLECQQSLIPMTWGISRPIVVLPTVWREWMVDCQRQVLLHELAHVKRFDVLYHLIARVACSIYWFHPLVWIALRRMRTVREMACDDCVVMVGERPSSYAQQLLNIARDFQAMDLPPAVAMAQRAGLEQRVRALLDKARSHLPVTARAGIVLFIGGLAFALLLAAIRLEAFAESAVSDTEHEATTQTTIEQSSEKAQPAKSKKLVYEGTVVDPNKKPVADAKLYFVFHQLGKFPDSNLKPLATTDTSGKFKFDVDPDDYIRLGLDDWKYAALFAAKEGLGVAWAPSLMFESTGAIQTDLELVAAKASWMLRFGSDKTLELVRDEQPIEGQIINVDGQPVVGALLRVKEVSWNASGTLEDWEKAVKHEKADYYSIRQTVSDQHNGYQLASVIPPVVTDANGRFTMRGIGNNRIVELIVSGPTIETVIVKCRTRDGEKVVLPHEFRSRGRSQGMGGIADEVYYPRKFTYIAAHSIPIIGRVTDVETREPIADCLVTAGRTFTFTGSFKSHIVAKTDQDGRFRLEGLPLQEGEFYIVPPTSTLYVPWGGGVKFDGNRDSVTRDVALRKAVLITGRAIDGRTNKPIPGVVEFLSLAKNSRLDDYKGFAGCGGHQVRTDKDGNYSITAVPGEGVLTFMALDHTRYQRAGVYPKIGTVMSSPSSDSGMKQTVPHFLFTADRHWVKDIVLPDAGPLNLDITLSAGESLSGKLLGKDGKPASDAIFSGAIEHSGWRPVTKEGFKIEGYYPDKPRDLYFFQRSTNTVAYLKLEGKITEPIQVTLKSAATLKGQIVDQNGAPMTNMILSGDTIPADLGDVSYRLMTDNDGRFEIRGLVPGQSYSVFGSRDGYSSIVISDVLIDEREVIDLGVIKLRNGVENE